MNEERMQILKMLEDGRITAEDADRLIDALGEEPREESRKGRKLTIKVTDRTTQKQKVNMTIPIGLAKIAAKFVPHKAKKKLADEGVDVDEVLSQVLTENIGKVVDVETEEDIVEIAIE
jgi:hypothetical protein